MPMLSHVKSGKKWKRTELNDKISDLERIIIWAYNELDIIPDGEYGRKLLKEYILMNEGELPESLKDN